MSLEPVMSLGCLTLLYDFFAFILLFVIERKFEVSVW